MKLAYYVFLSSILTALFATDSGPANNPSQTAIKLPQPAQDSKTSVEKALLERRSIRDYQKIPITLSELSQLLWAAQGVSGSGGRRTAPSAGALYPLDVYVVAGNVSGVSAGIYRYNPHKHELAGIASGDVRAALCDAALGQSPVKNAAAVLVFSAVYERTTIKYGERGIRYVYMEAGHAAQNVYLQAVSLGLGTVVIGAFHDDQVRKVLRLSKREHPLYIMPVGKI